MTDMDKLDKQLQSLGVKLFRASDMQKVGRIRSGLPFLDWALGGGIPRGRITYVFGEAGSGKSTASYRFAANAANAGWVLWNDVEKSWAPDWAMNFIAPEQMESIKVIQPAQGGGEGIVNACLQALQYSTPPSLIVIDSLTSIASSKMLDRDLEKSLVGVDAAFNNRLVRILNSANADTAILIIGQYREGIGTWNYVPGGNGIKHMASIIVKMASTNLRAKDTDTSDEEDRQQVGVISRFDVVKNKVSVPYRSGYEILLRDGYFDVTDSVIRLALQAGLITKAGAWYQMPDGTKVQGARGVREYFENNPLVYTEIEHGLEK